jgi:hypothetical protein
MAKFFLQIAPQCGIPQPGVTIEADDYRTDTDGWLELFVITKPETDDDEAEVRVVATFPHESWLYVMEINRAV